MSKRRSTLFDAMSKRRRTRMAVARDRIGALPDELLQYILSFLLSRDAVRTCVLAKRWRTLWKSVPALRIEDPEIYDSATGSGTFVKELLRRRDPTPLDVCIIRSYCEESVDQDEDWDEMVFERMTPLLQYAVSCQVQKLTIDFPLRVTNTTLISSHLKRLELHQMLFEGPSLDLSRCEVLEVLEINLCEIFDSSISSQSLKYLYINSCFTFDQNRTHIVAPNLLGFQMTVRSGLPPSIHSMPSLVTASVTLDSYCPDCGYDNLSCTGCCRIEDRLDCSCVLEALSGATNLELRIWDPSVFIFSRDLKWCPMIMELKTLLLTNWCMANDFTGLVYFLQHSPLLETLTIELLREPEGESVTETYDNYNQREQLLSKHLKLVTVLYRPGKEAKVPHIQKILIAQGVSPEQIVIQSFFSDDEDDEYEGDDECEKDDMNTKKTRRTNIQ